MGFRNITLEDRQLIETAWRKAGITDCDLSFANIFCWSDSYPVEICICGTVFVLRAALDAETGTVYTVPMCFDGGTGTGSSGQDGGIGDLYGATGDRDGREPDIDRAYRLILEDALANGETSKIMALDAAGMGQLRRRYPDMGFFYQRSHSDYIYLREDLALLQGHKYQAKRNHINKFKSEYAFEYAPLRSEDKDECLALLLGWRERRLEDNLLHAHELTPGFVLELDKEQKSICRAFDNFEQLGLLGGSIKVDGKIVAFCYGSAMTDDTFCTHIEKGDENFDGIFPAINELFAQHLPERFKYINREDDLGFPGLRNAKETYHPVKMLHKYIGIALTPLQQQVRQLWLECFPEDGPLDAEQFLLTQFSEQGMLARYDAGALVSMLHIIPFGDTAYIYAVCTAPQWRHRGIASELMQEAFETCCRQGYARLALIPQGEQAMAWYATMGFSPSAPESFIKSDYDFGRCDGTPDAPMIRILRESLA